MPRIDEPAPIFVGGRWEPARSKATREIRNPATGALIGVAADCGAEDVDRAVRAARQAQPAWGKLPGLEKAVALRRVGEAIRHMGKDLATLMARETGKPLVEAMDCIEWVAGCFEYYAEVGRASRGNSIPRWRRTSSTSPSRSRTGWWPPSCPSTSRCC